MIDRAQTIAAAEPLPQTQASRDPDARVARTSTWIALVVGLAATILLPLGYVTLSYEYRASTLRTETELAATGLSQLITSSPTLWQFQRDLMEQRLVQFGTPRFPIRYRVLLSGDHVVAVHGTDPPRPLMVHTLPLLDSGEPVGRVEVAMTARPLVAQGAAAALVGLLLGGLVFLALRVLPLQALQRSRRERERAEEALRRSEAAFRLLFADAPLPMWVEASGSGAILEVNEAAVARYGYERPRFLSMRASDLGAPPSDPTAPAGGAGNSTLAGEASHRTARGETIDVRLVSRRLELDGRQAVLVVAEDVTATKRAEAARTQLEAQLQQARRIEAVGRLAGGVAHDFNNLLTVVSGYAETLHTELAPGDPRREAVEHIRAASARAASLTRQLLAFGRKQILQPRRVDVNALVERMELICRRLAGAGVELVVDRTSAPAWVRADPAQLEQVLVTLVSRACDAMPAGGRLTVQTLVHEAPPVAGLAPGRHVELAIVDSGPGMDAETVAHLFEPFAESPSAERGPALGLAAAYGIVTQSGGQVAVDSAVERGTRLSVLLPWAAPEEAPPAPAAVEPAGPAEGRTLVLAEDQPSVRYLVERVLTSQGYTVLAAANGQEALALCEARATPPDLLVTDLLMPVMGGRELAERLRARWPELRVVFMTGFDPEVAAGLPLAPGQAVLLQKPFSNQTLLAAVQELLPNRDRA